MAAPAQGDGTVEDFTGPGSVWGARIARAVHTAVLASATTYRARLLPAIPHRRDDGADIGTSALGDVEGERAC